MLILRGRRRRVTRIRSRRAAGDADRRVRRRLSGPMPLFVRVRARYLQYGCGHLELGSWYGFSLPAGDSGDAGEHRRFDGPRLSEGDRSAVVGTQGRTGVSGVVERGLLAVGRRRRLRRCVRSLGGPRRDSRTLRQRHTVPMPRRKRKYSSHLKSFLNSRFLHLGFATILQFTKPTIVAVKMKKQ